MGAGVEVGSARAMVCGLVITFAKAQLSHFILNRGGKVTLIGRVNDGFDGCGC